MASAVAKPVHEDVKILSAQPVRSQQSVELILSQSGQILPPNLEGRWRDSLCDCFSDCPSCCCLFWCGGFQFVLIGQLAERIWQKGAYAVTFVAYVVVMILYTILMSIGGQYKCTEDDYEHDDYKNGDHTHEDGSNTNCGYANPAAYNAGMFFIGLFGFAMFILVCQLRTMTRQIYSINSGCDDNTLCDCCCAYWCMPCTICQLWRHVQDPRTSGANGCCGCGTKDGLPGDFTDRRKKEAWYGVVNSGPADMV